jgi:RHS repeat-associated protein
MIAHTTFVGYANVSQGTNVVPIVASDYSGHHRTNNFQVVVMNNGVAETLTYDLNGNLTNAVTATSTNTYQWDGANRMVSFTGPTNQSLFTYDGLGRRVQIIEKQNGVAVSTNKFVWAGIELCEQRDNTGANVTKRFFGEGEQISGTNYFFTRDHLGSVREMTDNSGSIRARYSYDPYGRQTTLQGDLEADFGYAGMYYHGASGLNLTLLRAYDSNLGRWSSRDPLGETVGLNLYDYVLNNPINWFDPYGACPTKQGGGGGGGGGGGQQVAKDASPILAKERDDITAGPIQGLINLWNNSTHSPEDPEYPGFDFKTGIDTNFIANGRHLNKAGMGNYIAGYGAQSYSNKYPMISPVMALAAMAAGAGLHLLNNLEAFSNKEFGFRFNPEQSEVGDWVDRSGIPDMAKGAWDALFCP